jgi:hypothetical protein
LRTAAIGCLSDRPVCPHIIRMEQLAHRWADFHGIYYSGIFKKNLPRKFKFT